jgi:VWFA-related protein
MYRPRLHSHVLLLSIICLTLQAIAQSPTSQSQSTQAAESNPTEPTVTLQTFSRMVNIELVVKDSKGNHIKGLKPSDFRLFEQIPSWGKEKREQKIAELREIHMADLRNEGVPALPTSPGVYSNGVQRPKDPVAPTILLVDGLNTAPENQAQVHVQMLRMLRQLPPNVPVSVFLLGSRLEMLQSFTSDPRLLQIALRKAINPAGVGVADIDPRDDPTAPGNTIGGFLGPEGNAAVAEMVAHAKDFDTRIYTGNMDMKVQRTINAMLSLGRNLAGYPGRKNLLWLSTAFPISINSVDSDYFRNYWAQLKKMNGALSEARISVYPVNLAGVQTLSFFSAASRPPDVSPGGAADAVERQQLTISNQQDTMEAIADGTGGKVCTGDNDLGDCVRKAMDDSSDYYELSYYPDSPSWNGEFRKILLSATERGARLSYRRGYYATPLGGGDPDAQQAALQADCEDYLDATSVVFTAKSLPADQPGQLKFGVFIDPAGLTLTPTNDGNHLLKVSVAVCTFNEKGWALKLMTYPVERQLDDKEYNWMLKDGSVQQTIFVPAPKPAAVRLLVRDAASGHLGSIHIKVDEKAASPGSKDEAENAIDGPRALNSDVPLREAAHNAVEAPGIGVALNVSSNPLEWGPQEVVVKLDVHDIHFEQNEDRAKAKLDLAFVELGQDGHILEGVKDRVVLALLPDTYSDAETLGWFYPRRLWVAGEAEKLRVVVRDLATGSLGSVSVPVHTYRRAGELSPKKRRN